MGTKPRTISPYDYDFISYDFLKQILPQPELFELRQVLAIPKEDIEARHEYMLCVIKDRVGNADVYEAIFLFQELLKIPTTSEASSYLPYHAPYICWIFDRQILASAQPEPANNLNTTKNIHNTTLPGQIVITHN